MLRFLLSSLKGALSALGWCFWFCGAVVTAPFRALLPGAGRSAIPSAPARTAAPANPSPVQTAVSPQMAAQREAAAVVGWLALRLRQGSGCPQPPQIISPSVRRWANSLADEQARRAIALGFTPLSDHLAGVKIAPGLPVHGANIAAADADRMNRRRPASRLIRTRNLIEENYAIPASLHR